LEAVAKISTHGELEFVLVDNGSSDRTRHVYDSFAASAPFPTRYVHESRLGVGWAMRAGLAATSGEIVLFTDDDCYPDSGIATHAQRVFSDARIGVAQGRVLLHDPTDARITIKEAEEPRLFRPGHYVRTGHFLGANLAFRRTALVRAGGIDPLFGPGSIIGSAADADAAGRVILEGWAGAYAPDLIVRHHHRRKSVDMAALQRRYDIGRGAYKMKQMLVAPPLVKPVIALALLRNLMRPLAPGVACREFVGALRYLKHRRRMARHVGQEPIAQDVNGVGAHGVGQAMPVPGPAKVRNDQSLTA